MLSRFLLTFFETARKCGIFFNHLKLALLLSIFKTFHCCFTGIEPPRNSVQSFAFIRRKWGKIVAFLLHGWVKFNAFFCCGWVNDTFFAHIWSSSNTSVWKKHPPLRKPDLNDFCKNLHRFLLQIAFRAFWKTNV